MGSSMRQIRRLTWRAMWIRIRQAVPLIGRALRGATTVWDQMWSLGLTGWSPAWRWVQLRQKMFPVVIWEVVCFFWKILFDFIDLTCILVWCKEEQWSSSLWSRSRSLERGSSSIAGEIGCLSINLGEARRLLRHKRSCRLSSNVIGPSEDRRLYFNLISPNVILC